MLKAFLNGYVSLFKSIALILVLLCAGSAICFAFVWPLWYLATNIPSAYTLFSVTFFGLLIVVALTGKICMSLKRCQNKDQKIKLVRSTFSIWFFRLAMAACLLYSFMSVLNGRKILGIILVFSCFILYGIYAAFVKNRRNED